MGWKELRSDERFSAVSRGCWGAEGMFEREFVMARE